MASGLAPVAARVGGAVEIIEEGRSGLFAAPLDGADLARKIEWLIEHPQVRSAIAVQAHARAQQYRWESIIDQLFVGYEQVLKNNRHQKTKSIAA
jgi:glycosyltransferase involved in cell wall biosynthesis